MDCLVGSVAQGTADTDRVIVAQVAPDFTYDHWYCVGGEFHTDRWIKVIDGFDQTDTSDLKEIINIFVVAGKTFDDT